MLWRVFASRSQAFGVQLMEWVLKLEICKVKLVLISFYQNNLKLSLSVLIQFI